nr:GAF domain-containing protein [Luteolibacter marinus]
MSSIPYEENADSAAVFRRITEAHARAMRVDRVGIWLYDESRSAIRCSCLYRLDDGTFSSGMALAAADHPAYFGALARMDVIAADDALQDPRTRGFATAYLEPLGITSMIDAPIMFKGKIRGVLCSEHVGAPRRWTGDEKTFVAAVANVVSLELEAAERRQAEASVREIQERFEIVANATNDAVWEWDIDSDEIWWNEGFEVLFGRPPAGDDCSSTAWKQRIHPADAARVSTGIREVLAGTVLNWTEEYRFQRADGSYACVLDRGFVVRDPDGRAVRMVGGMSDLTTRKQADQDLARLNRALRMLSACNEAQVRETTENGLLTEICRLAVDIGGYRMAWVGYARDDAGKSIEPMASAGTGTCYLDEIELSWDANHITGKGPGGTTIRSGTASVCEDIGDQSWFFHWIRFARKHGFASVICLPLRDGGRTFGILGLYGPEVISVGAEEIKLLQDLADSLSFGIGTIRAKMDNQRIQDVVLKVAQAVSSGTGTEFFDSLVKNLVAVLGAQGGLIGKVNHAGPSIDTVSFVLNGQLEENVSYGLAGTPCENVSEGNLCIFPDGIQELFPADHLLVVYGIHAYAGIPLHDRDGVAGIMVVFFSEPIRDVELVRSTLTIFAARAASELDRQVADARIREQASLLDKARDAILVRGIDHRISYWNKSAERLYGWTATEAMGRSARELLYADTTEFDKVYATVLESGEWMGELAQVDRNGRQLMIESRWTLLRDANDRPHSILTINTDVTEYRELHQQVLRSQRLESIGTLAGGIAHDLNNVLAPVSMSIELLRSEVTSERGRELLDTLASSAKRGADMVGQVLSFASGVEGRRIEVHAGRAIGDLLKIVRDTFPKNIGIESRISAGLPPVLADPTQIHQVLLNLCVNARDAMGDGGRILITAETAEPGAVPGTGPDAGPYLRLRIADTGPGISAENLDRIFEPFFTTKAIGKGTGLGLSTSLAIIRSHGGSIHAASPPGEGARFDVFLPCRPEPVDSPAPPSAVHLPRGRGETILVADDEEPVRRVTGQILESFGYRALLAADGREAVEMFQRDRQDIAAVITDMMMPGLDGASTIRELRRIDPDVRIIATSGIATRESCPVDAGEVRFIAKPYTSETLLTLLEEETSTRSSSGHDTPPPGYKTR